jgi:transketolase
MGSIRAKFEAFDWEVIDIEKGNNIEAIISGMTDAKSRTGKGKPVCVCILKWVMGRLHDVQSCLAWESINDAQLENALAQNPNLR